MNLEVNQDMVAVQDYLQTLGFSQSLRKSLSEADQLFAQTASEFALKSSMGHIRSFVEQLHQEAISAVHGDFVGPLPTGWGVGLAHLRKMLFLSAAEEKFAAGLHGLISDEGVHPLFAEREYARLARNMVVEYALLFLRKLEKLALPKSES